MSSESTVPRWLSKAAAADQIDVTTRTINRMIAAGELPAYRVGKRMVRIKQTDLDALLSPIPAGGAQRAS